MDAVGLFATKTTIEEMGFPPIPASKEWKPYCIQRAARTG